MRAFPIFLLLAAAVTTGVAADPAPRLRPPEWATPVIETSLGNCFQVSDELFRSRQPETESITDLQALGVRSILNLRNHHDDSTAFAKAGFTLLHQPMEAGDITVDELVTALRQIHDAPKPVLVHCLHGSDRTGTFVAAYRVAFQNWTREAALDEFRHGGFGFHEKWFPNLITLLATLDEAELRRRVLAP